MEPTNEQRHALTLFGSGESLAIEAGAGTGKTTTLRLLAESTDQRGQYLAFNKAIVKDSETRMPGRVKCNTAHSLAMRAVGIKYLPRLRSSARMKSWELGQRLGLDPISVVTFDGAKKTLSPPFLGGVVMRSIERFCQTADPEPTWRHMRRIPGLDDPSRRDGIYPVNNAVARHIESAMHWAWRDWTNENGVLPYKHAAYLKEFQLSDPYIAADFVLFDEAQDANPVMIDIVRKQTHAQLVWVGDSQQQIYGFTGAVNALADVPADHRAFLSQSFRFGPAIAALANMVLDVLDADLRLTGTETIPSRLDTLDDPSVVLTRTNATAVREVLGAIKAGKTVALVGGSAEILSFARAAKSLMNGERTSHPELACFESWGEVRDYVAQDEQGDDLRLLVSLIDDFGVEVIIEALDQTIPESRADLVVSTAHKSKGREWDSVRLASDFADVPRDEELRLLYVALTRAKLVLDPFGVPFLDMKMEVKSS